MKAPSHAPRALTWIEPLEARIAPAGLIIETGKLGAYLYSNAIFVDVNNTAASDDISAIVDDTTLPPGPGNLYYLKLNPGDRLTNASTLTSGQQPFITGPDGGALKGTVIAYFYDANMDNEVQQTELVGLSLGHNVDVEVGSSVHGDVVANYNVKTSKLGGDTEIGSATKLPANTITNLKVKGDVTGRIIGGGVFKSIVVSGTVESILAGTAANGVTYDLSGTDSVGGGDTLAITADPGKAGLSLSKISVGAVTLIQAGGGGKGGAGGSISKLTITSDTDGFTVLAGKGGAGDSTIGRPNGGAGGKISDVLVNGLTGSTDATANDLASFSAGAGGDAGTRGRGGVGGSISGLYYGYKILKNAKILSEASMLDAVTVQAGIGGSGRVGGAGGSITTTKIFSAPTTAGNDLSLLAGDGGVMVDLSGSAGKGGSVSSFDVINSGALSIIKVEAGDGGANSAGSGAAGGSISGGALRGYALELTAGKGSSGGGTGVGGIGGDIKSIQVTAKADVRAGSIALTAGAGGDGALKGGGRGGVVDRLTVYDADLGAFSVIGGKGGSSGAGTGASGGSISNLVVIDVATPAILGVPQTNFATFTVTAGNGGASSGSVKGGSGGKGGSITSLNLRGVDMSLDVDAGQGGAADIKGKGGAGGAIGTLTLETETADPNPLTAVSVTAGGGGAGAGNGNGGAGGALTKLNLTSPSDISIMAGNGGDAGATAAAGVGGSGSTISALAVDSGTSSSISVTAGSAGSAKGVPGTKAGNGGSLTTLSLTAGLNIDVTSGDGHLGGVGGNIKSLALDVGTLGTATVSAGDGSTSTLTKGGAGGSLISISGIVGGSATTNTFTAGNGGNGVTTAGVGGSITGIHILGTSALAGGTGLIALDAGSGGSVTTGLKGALGGSVNTVSVAETPGTATIVEHIAAGAGGSTANVSTKSVGGAGGLITKVSVIGDIGYRSGKGFGYTTMGGLFAGTYGTGTKNGLAGNVNDIAAEAIASIVAGRPVTGDAITKANLVNKATVINVGSLDSALFTTAPATKTNSVGAYTIFGTVGDHDPATFATLIGGVVTPGVAGANTFDSGEYGDVGSGNAGKFGFGDTISATTDGFVAVLNFSSDGKDFNVKPEALLTVDTTDLTGNTSLFIDLNNTNGQLHG